MGSKSIKATNDAQAYAEKVYAQIRSQPHHYSTDNRQVYRTLFPHPEKIEKRLFQIIHGMSPIDSKLNPGPNADLFSFQ